MATSGRAAPRFIIACINGAIARIVFPNEAGRGQDQRRMNESPQPSPPSPYTAGWWIAWIAGVVGGPALALVVAAIGQNARLDQTMVVLLITCLVAGLVAHLVASIGLARRVARRRNPETRAGAAIGLTLGLLFGGWAAMGAVFFVGCLGALAVG